MRIFLILGLALIFSSQSSLLVKIAPLTESLQNYCASLIPSSLANQKLAQSFTCGTALTDPKAKEIFQRTSLLHLMVVSGGHLQLLSFFIFAPLPSRLREKPFFITVNWLVLLFYCLLTGFQPPVVRAFVSRVFFAIAEFLRWHWDWGKIQIWTGLLLLLIFPTWILSLSFYLSWLASLGFLLTPLFRKSESSFRSKIFQTWVTCTLIQCLVAVGFSEFSFLGVVMNAVLAPMISVVLFPLSVLSIIIPATVPLVDAGWNLLLLILGSISNWSSDSSSFFNFKMSSSRWIFLWAFLAFVHCFFENLRQLRYQKSNV